MSSSTERENGSSSYPTETTEEQQHASVFQMMTSAVFPMVLHQAVELNLFEIMAKAGPGARMSSSDIASRLPTSNPDAPDMLDRMLYLLACYDVLTCSLDHHHHHHHLHGHDHDHGIEQREEAPGRTKRVYELGPNSKYFIADKDGVSFGPVATLGVSQALVLSWYKLKDSILEGGVAFDKVHGMNAFEFPAKNPEYNDIFNQSMYNHSTMVMREILKTYKGFEHLNGQTLVDVGGGFGHVISLIISQYPTIKGINFDLPHVADQAPVHPGAGHVGGDMFEEVPQGDAIFMKWILHDWSDAHCLKLLKNCYRALPETGRVIVVEVIIPEIPDSSGATRTMSHIDLMMMNVNPGGRERTRKEFQALARQAGFTRITFQQSFNIYWVMEFFK